MFKNISGRSWQVWRRNADVLMETWYLNFLPPFLEPIMYVLAFGFGVGSMIHEVSYQGHKLTYLAFMCPGVISVAVMFWAYFETTYPTFVRMNYQRTFDAVLATPLLVEDVIVGECLWGATKSVMAAVIMTIILGCFGLVSWPSVLWVLPISILGGVLFSSVGLITTAVCPKIDMFNIPIFVFIFPMFLFSGTFFPLDVLPTWAMYLAYVLPLTHVSVLIRAAFLGFPIGEQLGSIAYLAVVVPAFFSLALVLMKKRLTN